MRLIFVVNTKIGQISEENSSILCQQEVRKNTMISFGQFKEFGQIIRIVRFCVNKNIHLVLKSIRSEISGIARHFFENLYSIIHRL
jgi:methyltransferase-like protein